ncbi:MAG: hypothetical protein OEV66_03910 [Spirochaetia bacterium]|nr:hypothetical protein [Spirochaetia bacterium]
MSSESLSDKERTALIRKGNQAFNDGNIDLASRIFKTTQYKDGLIRVGDYYYFDMRQPLMAYGYYKRANHQIMIEKISDGFIFALKYWLADGKTPEN